MRVNCEDCRGPPRCSTPELRGRFPAALHFGPRASDTAGTRAYDYTNTAQAEALRKQLAPMSRYLQRMVDRLEKELRVDPADLLL
jgi:hypothetical protein